MPPQHFRSPGAQARGRPCRPGEHPGWIYLRLRERLRPPSQATGIHELLEVVTVGLATTGASATAVALAPHRWLPFLVDLDTWTAQGHVYLRDHVRAVIVTAFAIFVLALSFAYVVHRVQRFRLPAEFRPQGSVWVHALGKRPEGMVPWVGLSLDDGRLVEGVLHSFSLVEDDTDQRDIALQRPIRMTHQEGATPQELPDLDRLIVSSQAIKYIAVAWVAERK